MIKSSILTVAVILATMAFFAGSAIAQNELLDSLGHPKDIKHNVDQIQIMNKVIEDVNSFPVAFKLHPMPGYVGKYPVQTVFIDLPVEAKVNGYYKKILDYPNKHSSDFVPAISIGRHSETSKETTTEVSLTLGVSTEAEAGVFFAKATMAFSVEAGLSHSWTSGLTEGESIGVEVPVLPESVLQVWQPVMETNYTFQPQTRDQIYERVKQRLGSFTLYYISDPNNWQRIQNIIANGITATDPQNLAIPSYFPHPDAAGSAPLAAVTEEARRDTIGSTPAVEERFTGLDARSVKNVTAAQQGQAIAIYQNNPDGSWSEIGTREDGTTRNFREVRREGSSIYLTDDFANIHLDLNANKINYTSTAGENIPGLYEIIGFTTH